MESSIQALSFFDLAPNWQQCPFELNSPVLAVHESNFESKYSGSSIAESELEWNRSLRRAFFGYFLVVYLYFPSVIIVWLCCKYESSIISDLAKGIIRRYFSSNRRMLSCWVVELSNCWIVELSYDVWLKHETLRHTLIPTVAFQPLLPSIS